MSKRAVSIRQNLSQFLKLLLMVSSAVMAWRTLGIITGCDSPFMAVLSESMEPAFERGSILFATLEKSPVQIGEIIVYKLKGKPIPIVHRVIEIHDSANQSFILTKGDNNRVDDRGLYEDAVRGQLWINAEDIVGRVKGQIPYLGMIPVWLGDYPQLKMVLLGAMALFTLMDRGEG